MTFAKGLIRTYAEAGRFLLALPLLAVAIVAVEGLQHAAEWSSGMYASAKAAALHAADPSRLVTGTLKVVWLNAVGFWVFRFVTSGSARRAVRPGLVALRQFAPVLAFLVALTAITLWPPALLPAGSARRAVSLATLAVEVVTFPLGVALAPWIVGAALGDVRATPIFAVRRAWGSIWWGVGLSLLSSAPLLAIHYALGLGAIGKAQPLALAMLTVDAGFVGYLGVAVSTGQLVVAERMAERAGERLLLEN